MPTISRRDPAPTGQDSPAQAHTGGDPDCAERRRILVIAIIAALASALLNAVAAYFEQAATKRVRGDQDVPASQWGTLIKEPRWLGGQLADVTAFGLTAVALAFGGLILVEPLLVMSLPFAVGLRIVRRHPSRCSRSATRSWAWFSAFSGSTRR